MPEVAVAQTQPQGRAAVVDWVVQVAEAPVLVTVPIQSLAQPTLVVVVVVGKLQTGRTAARVWLWCAT